MKKFLLIAAILFASPAYAEAVTASPEGLWLTENERSVIAVAPCKGSPDKLCGHIHWIIKDGMQFDTKNPDAARHTTPMCGLQILTGFKKQDARNWIDGEIYKADDGEIYDSTLMLLPTGKMLVRGYVGMPLFGKSQTWTPVSARDYPRCKPAKR